MKSFGTEDAGLAGSESRDLAPTTDRNSPMLSKWSRFSGFVMWSITLGLLAGAMLRIVCHDASDLLVWFNAFTLYVYLPSYVLLVAAAWQRRWSLVAANLLIILCHLTWVAPDFRPATPYPAQLPTAAASRQIRIFCANIRAENSDRDGVLREIASVDPDVVVLIEYRRWWTHSLQDSPVLKPYKYGTNLYQPYAGEVAVFSRLPIAKQQLNWIGPRLNNIVDIPLGETSLRLFCLHSPRPFYESPFGYGEFWQQELSLLSQQPRPLVVIGDFNVTQFSKVYQELISTDLRSAHSDRGRGFATTWPNGIDPLPPIRIDQALLSPQVECLSIVEGTGYGSDHKPLIVDIRVHLDDSASAATSAER